MSNITKNFNITKIINKYFNSKNILLMLSFIGFATIGTFIGFAIHGALGACFGLPLGYVFGKLLFI